MNVTLEDVKNAIGITGDYQDDTVQQWFDETVEFLTNAGVKSQNITVGIVARGVLDIWNYGAGDGKLSDYFMKRAAQLALKN